VLRGAKLDLVVVVSPMSGPPGRAGIYAASRRHAARQLRREISALESAGTRTIVIAPNDDEQQVMGDNLMSGRHVRAVIAAARAATQAKLSRSVVELLSDG
jgi:NTE family protein